MPAVRAVFKDGEVTAVTVTFDPELLGQFSRGVAHSFGEEFNDVVVPGDVTGYWH